MERKVTFTKKFKMDFDKVLFYLEKNWSKKVAAEYSEKIYDKVYLIIQNPSLFEASKTNSKIRKCVVSKQNSLYFKFSETEIIILTLFDNRMSPEKLKINIKKER
jgi:plasmid stabilization system protein ParE